MRLGGWRFPLFRLAILAALAYAAFWVAGRDDVDGRALVVDGDTLRVSGQTIRLYGIDAPELGQTCLDRNGAVYDCGRLAQRELERLTKSEVSCDAKDVDQYDRDISICFANDKDLGQEMVSSGWARAYLSYSLRYAPAETKARANRRGMWDGEFVDPWAFRQDNVEDDLIAFVWRWVMDRIF